MLFDCCHRRDAIAKRTSLRSGDHGGHSSRCEPKAWTEATGAPGLVVTGHRRRPGQDDGVVAFGAFCWLFAVRDRTMKTKPAAPRTKVDWLRRTRMFANRPKQELEFLARHFDFATYPAGEELVREGCVPTSFNVILEGLAWLDPRRSVKPEGEGVNVALGSVLRGSAEQLVDARSSSLRQPGLQRRVTPGQLRFSRAPERWQPRWRQDARPRG
jgi:hypothetical protein